jgi:hypothetical protein
LIASKIRGRDHHYDRAKLVALWADACRERCRAQAAALAEWRGYTDISTRTTSAISVMGGSSSAGCECNRDPGDGGKQRLGQTKMQLCGQRLEG